MTTEETYIIYADVLFLINFVLDFLCLYVSGAILSVRIKTGRVVLASAAGGFYSIGAMYFSFLPAYIAFPIHAAAALLMCLIAYGYGSFKMLVKRTVMFAVTAAFSGGVLSAAFTLTGRYYTVDGGFYAEISPLFLIAVAVLSVGAAYVYALLCHKRAAFVTADAIIEKNGKAYRLNLLVDSGCFVLDPMTGKRVIIVSSSVFGGVPPDTPRLIPVKAAGGSRLLYGFRPDRITVKRLGRPDAQVDAVVAVDADTASFSGCGGLIPPSLI